jgi:hypothetical protein
MEMISALPNGIWRSRKLEEIKSVIQGCLGLYLEATASEPVVTPGDNVEIRFECIARTGGAEVVLTRVNLGPGLLDTLPSTSLQTNSGWILEKSSENSGQRHHYGALLVASPIYYRHVRCTRTIAARRAPKHPAMLPPSGR